MIEKLFVLVLMPFESMFDDIYRYGTEAAADLRTRYRLLRKFSRPCALRSKRSI